MSLERAVSQKDAHNYLQEYSIKLGPGDDPNNPASEQRGVMVIKSKSKTRAKQRKGAVANWKVVYYSPLLHLNFIHPKIRRKSRIFTVHKSQIHTDFCFIQRRKSLSIIIKFVSTNSSRKNIYDLIIQNIQEKEY